MFVLDASVIVKWFSEEQYTAEALDIRGKFLAGECNIAVPDLLLYELANSLRYNPSFNEADVEQAITSLFDMGIDIIAPVSGLITEATKLAFRHDITIYDAFYIALATDLGYALVTSDMKLHQKVKQLDFVKFLSGFNGIN
ncbi:MAG: hypothetical protein COT13_06060 [Chloroflexi bacterium CG08_land_8_20_14_0_20_45_12]|nr:MAG: hypothetical protein COT13_06060 [Chloroflexi bacterium CG08_land_8_20_14_0_20_45_12]